MEQLEVWYKKWNSPEFEFYMFINETSQDYIFSTLDPNIIHEVMIIKRLEDSSIHCVNYKDFSQYRRLK